MINLKKLRKFFHAVRIAGIVNQIGKSIFQYKSEYIFLFCEAGKLGKRSVPFIEKQKDYFLNSGRVFFDGLNLKMKNRSKKQINGNNIRI